MNKNIVLAGRNMFLFKRGRQEAPPEPTGTGVDVLKELWDIGDDKKAFETLHGCISSDIYNVPTSAHAVPRRSHGRS